MNEVRSNLLSRRDREIVSALNILVEACIDDEKGFWEASADVRDDGTKLVLVRIAEDRARFVAILQEVVAAMHAAPENEGSATGGLYRAWSSVRKAIEGRSDRLVLEDCVTALTLASKRYRRALEVLAREHAPDAVLVSIDAQHARIREDLRELSSIMAGKRRSTVPPAPVG